MSPYLDTTTVEAPTITPPSESTTTDSATRETTPDIPTSSTLYPKISGKLLELSQNIAHLASTSPAHKALLREPIPFTGTVKLHGTHADIIVYPPPYPDTPTPANSTITYQSRNRTDLTPQSDNLGFVIFCSKRTTAILDLTTRILTRWTDLHSETTNASTNPVPTISGPIILAGEYIGTGIQKSVAISALPRQFILCSIRINGTWESISHYADIEVPEPNILNISRGGFYNLSYHYTNPEAFMVEAKKLTLEVAENCPFGKAMGVEGKGEGIVWTPARVGGLGLVLPGAVLLPNISDFWLKTKGEHFATLRKSIISEEEAASCDGQKVRARLFAANACLESRLEQGWQYLQEMGIQRDMKAMGTFLSWLTRDIEVEEKGEIDEGRLGNGWKGEVSKIAKPWYQVRISDEEMERLKEGIGKVAI